METLLKLPKIPVVMESLTDVALRPLHLPPFQDKQGSSDSLVFLWKVICLRALISHEAKDTQDLENHFPGCLAGLSSPTPNPRIFCPGNPAAAELNCQVFLLTSRQTSSVNW